MHDNKRQYAHDIRDAIRMAVQHVENNPANVHIPTSGQRGAVVGIINHIAGGDDNRKLLLGWLFANDNEVFSRMSTKSLSDAQWSALYAWCDFRKDEDRIIWVPKTSFPQECLAVLSAAMDDYFDVNYGERDDLPVPPDLVANALEYGGGEITHTGIKTAGVSVPDDAFAHEKSLPEVKPVASPYRLATAGKPDDIEEIMEKKPAIRPAISDKKPPKLYNPF